MYFHMAAWCMDSEPAGNVIGAQHLFSVYVHTPPGTSGAPLWSSICSVEPPRALLLSKLDADPFSDS
jgi:hypothetical protein